MPATPVAAPTAPTEKPKRKYRRKKVESVATVPPAEVKKPRRRGRGKGRGKGDTMSKLDIKDKLYAGGGALASMRLLGGKRLMGLPQAAAASLAVSYFSNEEWSKPVSNGLAAVALGEWYLFKAIEEGTLGKDLAVYIDEIISNGDSDSKKANAKRLKDALSGFGGATTGATPTSEQEIINLMKRQAAG